MSSQQSELTDGELDHVLRCLDELETLCRTLQWPQTFDPARARKRLVDILTPVVDFLEKTTGGGAMIHFLGDADPTADVRQIAFAQIVGKTMTRIAGEKFSEGVMESIKKTYADYHGAKFVQKFEELLPPAGEGSNPGKLPPLDKPATAFANKHCPVLIELRTFYEDYELLSPPEVPQRVYYPGALTDAVRKGDYWGDCKADDRKPLIMLRDPRTPGTEADWCQTTWSPPFFDIDDGLHRQISIHILYRHCSEDPMFSTTMKLHWGGPAGIRLQILALQRAFYNIYCAMKTKNFMKEFKAPVDLPSTLVYFRSCLTMTMDRLKVSMTTLQCAREANLRIHFVNIAEQPDVEPYISYTREDELVSAGGASVAPPPGDDDEEMPGSEDAEMNSPNSTRRVQSEPAPEKSPPSVQPSFVSKAQTAGKRMAPFRPKGTGAVATNKKVRSEQLDSNKEPPAESAPPDDGLTAEQPESPPADPPTREVRATTRQQTALVPPTPRPKARSKSASSQPPKKRPRSESPKDDERVELESEDEHPPPRLLPPGRLEASTISFPATGNKEWWDGLGDFDTTSALHSSTPHHGHRTRAQSAAAQSTHPADNSDDGAGPSTRQAPARGKTTSKAQSKAVSKPAAKAAPKGPARGKSRP